MRVTDELVERLGYALDACEFKTPYADVPSMLRRILEDVLLHVPEPRILIDEVVWKQTQERIAELETLRARSREWAGIAGRNAAEVVLAEKRLAELEAQLASVRPVDAVERIMRKHDVVEIHFWQEGRSYDAFTGEGFDVSITLRNGRGVYSGMTLGEAAAKLPDEVPQ